MRKFWKRKTVHRTVCSLLAVVMLCSLCRIGGTPVSGASSNLTDATVQAYEEKIAALQSEIKKSQTALAKLQRESASLSTYKAELDTYLETVNRQMEATNLLIGELENSIAAKTEEIEKNTAAYNETYQKFLDMMVLTYEEGDASYIGLILGADSLGDFLSRLERVSSMLEYNRTIMTELDATGKQLDADKAALDEAYALQAQYLADYEAAAADYQEKCDDVNSQISALALDQSAAQKELAKIQAQEAELDKELEAYLVELQKKNQGTLEAGDWGWPLPLNSGAYCSSVYGYRILYGVWDYHRGWDLACWLGTDIYAAKSGTVVISTYHYSYGNYVVIDHGGGISTVYAHCSKLLVSVGDKVEKGDLIAKVGTTGNSTGYHLHFEFRKNGQHTDPFEFIPNPPITVGASRFSKW